MTGQVAPIQEWQTVVVDTDGVAICKDLRALHEKDRIAKVKAAGIVPECVGPAVPLAPARGAFRVFEGQAMERTDTGGARKVRTGFEGRKTIQGLDNLDQMNIRAVARGKSPVLNNEQLFIARRFRDLVHEHDAMGVKLSSIEGVSSGGGQGGCFLEKLIDMRDEIAALRRKIGADVSMEVRRIRPSVRGSRQSITDIRLVEMVCLQGRNISYVLESHNWANDALLRAKLQAALRDALNRMLGGTKRRKTSVVHF